MQREKATVSDLEKQTLESCLFYNFQDGEIFSETMEIFPIGTSFDTSIALFR